MADSGVYDRWYRTVDGRRVASVEHGQGKRWQARWRDEAGRQRKQNYDRRADAERALAAIKADLARGAYIDPRGRAGHSPGVRRGLARRPDPPGHDRGPGRD